MIDKKQLHQIDNEKEYNEQLKIYMKRMRLMIFDVKKAYKNPDVYLNNFESLLEEMVYIQLITLETANGYRRKLYTEINSPTKFKIWLEDKMKSIGDKFSKKDNVK